jgi:hypothetical protein
VAIIGLKLSIDVLLAISGVSEGVHTATIIAVFIKYVKFNLKAVRKIHIIPRYLHRQPSKAQLEGTPCDF